MVEMVKFHITGDVVPQVAWFLNQTTELAPCVLSQTHLLTFSQVPAIAQIPGALSLYKFQLL